MASKPVEVLHQLADVLKGDSVQKVEAEAEQTTPSAAAASSPAYQIWSVEKPFLSLHCSLGEGPYYEPGTHSLRFVDVRKRHLHTLDLGRAGSANSAANGGQDGGETAAAAAARREQALSTLELDTPVSITADIEGVDPALSVLVGAKEGLAVLERKSGKYRYLARYQDIAWGEEEAVMGEEEKARRRDRMRSNDGKVDAEGRFWVGTMNDFHVGPLKPEGVLYKLDHDLSLHAMKGGLTIPNGLSWLSTVPTRDSDHPKTMYFSHTSSHHMLAFAYDAAAGTLADERVFWQHENKTGEPDGFAVDVEGCFWQCVYGEGRVLRISPAGKVVGEVRLPTRCCTCPAFVGTELWITSATDDREGEEGKGERWEHSREYEGGLFRIDVGVEGKKPHAFKPSVDLGI